MLYCFCFVVSIFDCLSDQVAATVRNAGFQCTALIVLYLCAYCREEEAIHIDGLSPSEVKQLREQSEKHVFQAEVNRMMKLIINSLYRNKEVCPCQSVESGEIDILLKQGNQSGAQIVAVGNRTPTKCRRRVMCVTTISPIVFSRMMY